MVLVSHLEVLSFRMKQRQDRPEEVMKAGWDP
jgi:hypothetical protein